MVNGNNSFYCYMNIIKLNRKDVSKQVRVQPGAQ